MSDHKQTIMKLTALTSLVGLMGLSGCQRDVEYRYDVPTQQAQCPTGMTHRDGGPGIVDRDGGAGIVDRDGDTVSAFCEEAVCPGGNWSTDPAIIDWHLSKGVYVVANRVCLAIVPTPVIPIEGEIPAENFDNDG